jgi:hypothetical protein
MKRNLLLLVLIFLIQSAFSSEDTIRALIRIEKKQGHLQVTTTPQGTSLPTVFASKEVRKKMNQLENGTEAIVEGKIHYEFSRIEGSHFSRPNFVISKIMPISLKDLGNIDDTKIESHLNIAPQKSEYIPPTIPITTEVASAITLTTSVLLMNELTSGQSSGLNKDLSASLFLTTGIFATILFIYEQIEGKK